MDIYRRSLAMDRTTTIVVVRRHVESEPTEIVHAGLSDKTDVSHRNTHTDVVIETTYPRHRSLK